MPHRRLGIYVLETYQAQRAQNVDSWDKPGHDATEELMSERKLGRRLPLALTRLAAEEQGLAGNR
jgi:hypothetical protein